MIGFVAKKLFGSKNERELKRLWPDVEKINSLEKTYQAKSDAELRSEVDTFKEKLAGEMPVTEALPEVFSIVREASKRTLGMRHFDVQLVGGMVLNEGRIAEMRTGEGKTLCATLPVVLNALTGKGVHLVTVNDYLAKRDAEWMSAIYSFLGLSTGVVVNGMDAGQRYKAYRCDITYGQNNEFGFDYLRDNMKLEVGEMVQRKHNYAIVDEVDSILIDEARTPLIISGPSDKPTEKYKLANDVVRHLKEETHFEIELKGKNITLTDEGVKRIEEVLELDNLYDPSNIEIVHHVNQALKAHYTMKRDFDYVVRDNQIIIVDEFTGRLMAGRRWSDGLHQAVEAKEGVSIARENQTLATITFQNYFRMYDKLSGMTGTADTESVEFKKIYDLDVVVIPTNKPMVRKDHQDVIFPTEKAKYKAVCDEIEEIHEQGRPILVGTASIARSEMLADILSKRKIKHHVLNAKQHEQEAYIVAQAGRKGAVTISTNMAGRGTDIILGGNPEFLAEEELGERDLDSEEYQALLSEFQEVCKKEKEEVLEAGGLHILGTERHESRRIDNQLRGRSGRQGDPGSSRFYVSFEDDLMKRFGGERMQSIMARVGLEESDALEGKLVARAIENAQKRVEGFNFDIRKHLLEYDDVMNKQREVVYSLRAKILRNEGVESELSEMIAEVIEDIILSRAHEKRPVHEWNVAEICREMKRIFGIDVDEEKWTADLENQTKAYAQVLFDDFHERAKARYEQRADRFGQERMKKLERIVILQSIDHFWKEHLSHIDHLKEGIGLRGYAQKNPLHEYQREAFLLFTEMMIAVKVGVIQNLFIPELPSEEEIAQMEEREREMQRAREEAARTIHEEVNAVGGGVEQSAAAGGQDPRRQIAVNQQSGQPSGNRKARRRKQKQAKRKKG